MKDKDQQTLDDAREQADEHDGFLRSGKVKARESGEEFTIPNLLLLDDDQQEKYDDLIHRLNQCDRHPDVEIPEQIVPQRVVKSTDPETGEVTETTVAEHVIPARTVRGDFIEPYQKDGVRVTPSYNIQIAQILLGDKYEAFKEGGGRSADVRMELLRMRRETEERARNDSKSRDGSSEDSGVLEAD